MALAPSKDPKFKWIAINAGILGGTGKIAPTQGAGITAVNIASGATLNPGDAPLSAGHLTIALSNATSKVNLANGSSLVYGHPQAPTGTRGIAELIEVLRRRGGGTGLFTGCAAGDTGAALVLRVDSAGRRR